MKVLSLFDGMACGMLALQSNANLGVTKLELLTHVNPLDRKEFMEQVDDAESASQKKSQGA